jgi:hypothetical protein
MALAGSYSPTEMLRILAGIGGFVKDLSERR